MPPNKKPGPKPKPIDADQVRDFAARGMTQDEIGAHFGLSGDTIRQRHQSDYKRGVLLFKGSLRRRQFETAMGAPAQVLRDGEGQPMLQDGEPVIITKSRPPNPTMQIWLGKNMLGQTDVDRAEQGDPEPDEKPRGFAFFQPLKKEGKRDKAKEPEGGEVPEAPKEPDSGPAEADTDEASVRDAGDPASQPDSYWRSE